MSASTATKSAFSLAEIMVLIALVTISVLGVLSAQMYAIKCSQFNRARYTAATILESELNRARAELNHDFTVEVGHPTRAVSGQPDFQCALESIYSPGSSDEFLKQLTAEVYWTDRESNEPRSVRAKTWVQLEH